jgi:tRNA-2-methylthio-N6-dimethylallyladenosine synthase
MHRGCNRERFLGIVEKLRRVRPEIGITTDLIVGFPGETDEDFEETLSLVRAAQFDNGYLFKYSPRKDTPAAALPGQVPQPVKEERNARLLALVNEIAAQRYTAQVGRRMEVLVEGPSRRNAARQTGRTRCNRIVVFEDHRQRRGELLELSIGRAGSFTLYGVQGVPQIETPLAGKDL